MKSVDVRIWSIRPTTRPTKATKSGAKRSKPTYELRWRVGTRPFSKTFATKALADAFRTNLSVAAREGEAFDTVTGLPESMSEPEHVTTWAEFAAAYVDMKWKGAAAKSRDSMTDALATVLPVLVQDRPGRPDVRTLRRVLRRWYLSPDGRDWDGEVKPSADAVAALAWLKKASLPVSAINDPVRARAVLDALTLKMDGGRASAEVVRRKRAVFANVLKYAIERGELADNPLRRIGWTPPRTAVRVDRRRVPNPKQVRELLTAVSYVGGYRRARGRRLVAFFACMYYAMMRPAEVVGLTRQDCELPETGWGSLTLAKSRPSAGKRWTDSGAVHDDRGLKQRADGETRIVPIPPVLVRMLREHLDTFGTADDGRLFFNERKGVLGSSTYSRVWSEARALALLPHQTASALADRPYDLRHAGVSLGLRTTRDPARIAERAGHSVEVLMTRYSWVLDDQDEHANRAIEAALGGAGDDDQADATNDDPPVAENTTE